MRSTKIYVCSKVLGNITKEQHFTLFTLIEAVLPCCEFGDIFIDSQGDLRAYFEWVAGADNILITKEGEVHAC
jgi:hypothetical protein